jgi:hypothetical protein
MSEEEQTAPVVSEEPKEEEAVASGEATGEDAPAKEEESTATFEPVVSPQSVIARPQSMYGDPLIDPSIHSTSPFPSTPLYHDLILLFLCYTLSFVILRSN